MRATRAAAMVLVLVGAVMASPAARAHGGDRVVVRERPARAMAAFGHTRHCTWNPSRWEVRVVRHVVRSGYWRTETVPAVTALRWDSRCWRLVRVIVRPAEVRRVWEPALVREERSRVLVPGRWACEGHRDC